MEHPSRHQTTLGDDATYGLGEITLQHPPETSPITPATRISIEAIGVHKHLLHGIGIDWGCGGGCLSIATSRIHDVNRVVGFDISEDNVATASENARLNKVEAKTKFMRSDAFQPFSNVDRHELESLKGKVNFILANPPSSENDDGFEFRRIVLRGAREFLVSGGCVFLSISYQYGMPRITNLEKDVPGFHHEGVLATTDCVPFDLERPDLMHCMENALRENNRAHNFTYRGLEFTGNAVSLIGMLGLLWHLHPIAVGVIILVTAPEIFVRGHYAHRHYRRLTSRASAQRMAHHILVLEEGQLLEEGSHEDLVALKGKYAEMFDTQAKSYR